MINFYNLRVFLESINSNRFFNYFYNSVNLISFFYVIFILIKQETNIIVIVCDLLFFVLFVFELFVRYISIGNFKKFWKNYYLDVISLIGWVPIYYFSEFALLRMIRFLRLLVIFKLITSIDKRLRILFRNIFIIFLITVFLIIISVSIISFNYDIDVMKAFEWSLYVIFTGEIPEGLEKENLFWIGMVLIVSNGLLLAGIIGSMASYIMEKFRNISDFDSIPNISNLVLIINYDKEIIVTLIKEYFKMNIKNKNKMDTKFVIVSNMNDKDYEQLAYMLEYLPYSDFVRQNVYIVNEDPLLHHFYEKIFQVRDKIKRIFIIPDERIEDDYHKDTIVAFIAMNIINYIGRDFCSRRVFALTNTNIVNIPNIHIVRSYEIISKLMNIEIEIPYIGLVEKFLVSFSNRLIEVPISEVWDVLQNIDLLEFIKFLSEKYRATFIGYINSSDEFINFIPLYSKLFNSDLNLQGIIEIDKVKSFLLMK